MLIYTNYFINALFITLALWAWYKYSVSVITSKVYWAAASLKFIGTIALGLLYYVHYESGDTLSYYDQADQLRDRSIRDFMVHEFSSISLAKPSRAILFTRIAAAVAYVTRGDYWVVSAYFSYFSFTCISYLVAQAIKTWESLKWPVTISFFFYPTVIFWSSGLLKESLAFGGLCLLVGATLNLVYLKRQTVGAYFGVLFGVLILIVLKYYIAAIVIPTLAFLTLYRLTSYWSFAPRSIVLKVFGIMTILILPCLFFLNLISHNFRWDRFFGILEQSRLGILEKTTVINRVDTLVFFKNSLDYIVNALWYMFSGLFNPVFLENWVFPNWISAVENLVLFMLFVFALVRFNTWKYHLSLELVVVVFYVLVASSILTYAIPNLGAMARFKIYYTPFLMVVIITVLKQQILDKRN